MSEQWKMAPVEPTDEMLTAALEYHRGSAWPTMLGIVSGYKRMLAAAPQPPDDELGRKYNELLYAVENKFPGETRHETALRYITQREAQSSNGPGQSEHHPDNPQLVRVKE